jgi:hypothetical protein
MAGEGWVGGFLKHHPDLSLIMPNSDDHEANRPMEIAMTPSTSGVSVNSQQLYALYHLIISFPSLK